MMRGDGEATWNNGPGASSRSPSARQSGRQTVPETQQPVFPARQKATMRLNGVSPSSSARGNNPYGSDMRPS